MRQLYAFARCKYSPSVAHLEYQDWQRRGKREVTKFLSKVVDTVAIIPDKLYLNE